VLEVGARGFVLKSDAARDLVAAVEALQRRTTFFTSDVATIVLDGYLTHSLGIDKPPRTVSLPASARLSNCSLRARAARRSRSH
jgi:DNA-binding NarL/FixJ family response regulator